jgi:hypothetical protein
VEPPDTLEKGVRFGCGFLLGCAATFGVLLTSVATGRIVLAWCLLGGLVCGYAAMRLGDAFWEGARRWWFWW